MAVSMNRSSDGCSACDVTFPMLHLIPMKLLLAIPLVLLLAPVLAIGQGVRMSPDFLPLEAGNRWVYDVLNEDGMKIGQTDFSIQERTIISGRSFYVVTRFPFLSEGGDRVKLIRYDARDRQYTAMINNEERALFFDGVVSEVLQTDDSGLPQKFVLQTDTATVTFQRGVGIVEARIHGAEGIRVAKIANVRVGERRAAVAGAAGVPAGPPSKSPVEKARDSSDNVTAITEENPLLDVEVTAAPEGNKFILTVMNTADKLLPFHFASGQTYDFAVIDPATGQEIWRWSRRMMFTSQVVRTEAILPNKQWKFEVAWNRRDNDLNPVPAGQYKLVGFVATRPPVESNAVTFEVR